MKTLPISVTCVDADGETIRSDALKIVCPDCDCDRFIIYVITSPADGRNHLQCVDCGRSFCQVMQHRKEKA